MKEYLETFERRNLVRGVEYDKLRGRAKAHEILSELRGSGRVIILLGRTVQESFDWAMRGSAPVFTTECLPPLLVHPQEAGGCTWRQVPHPSGRNLWYNEPKNVRVVELLLEELYVNYHKAQEKSA